MTLSSTEPGARLLALRNKIYFHLLYVWFHLNSLSGVSPDSDWPCLAVESSLLSWLLSLPREPTRPDFQSSCCPGLRAPGCRRDLPHLPSSLYLTLEGKRGCTDTRQLGRLPHSLSQQRFFLRLKHRVFSFSRAGERLDLRLALESPDEQSNTKGRHITESVVVI